MSLLKAGDPSWERHVPAEVARLIRERGLFGFAMTAAPA